MIILLAANLRVGEMRAPVLLGQGMWGEAANASGKLGGGCSGCVGVRVLGTALGSGEIWEAQPGEKGVRT